MLAYCLAVVTGCNEGSLVAHVGNVGTGEAGSLTREEVDVETLVGLYRFKVNLEDGLALVEVGQVDMYLTVETSGTHEG